MKKINAKTLSKMVVKSEIGEEIEFAEQIDSCGNPEWWHGIKKTENFDAICYVIGFYGGGQTHLLDVTFEEELEVDVVEDFIKIYFQGYGISDEIYLDNDVEI